MRPAARRVLPRNRGAFRPSSNAAPVRFLPLALFVPRADRLCRRRFRACPNRAKLDPPSAGGSNRIRHVLIIVQENRSFDNLFSGFPGADGATTGRLRDGRIIPLAPISLADPNDIEHDHKVFVNEYDGGKMDGFGNDAQGGNPGYTLPLSAVKRSEITPYWQLAASYALADRMFESVQGDSFPAHQFLIAAQAAGVIDSPNNVPWGCDAPPGTQTRILEPDGSEGPGPFPCFGYPTLAATLDSR